MQGKLHGLDNLNLANLRFEVQAGINWAVESGRSSTGMAERNGHAHGFMRIPWLQDRRTEDWAWSTLYGLTEPAGLKVQVRVKGFELIETPLYQMGLDRQLFLGVGILDALEATRKDLGVSYEQMGETLGMVKSATRKLIHSDDPRLATLYRAARGIGGQLILRTVTA